MKNSTHYTRWIFLILIVTGFQLQVSASNGFVLNNPPDTIPDSLKLRYPIPREGGIDSRKTPESSPLYFSDPSNITTEVEFNPQTGEYEVKRKIGNLDYRPAKYMDLNEYLGYDLKNSLRSYWKERSMASAAGGRSGIIPDIYIGGEAFDRIFGSNTIDIRPQGSAELIFGVTGNRRDDPTINVRQRQTLNFDFQQKIQMNVIAKIGEKIEFKANYNTESSFNFDNKVQLKYEGDEDEIIKLIEAGDVTLPLNSTLIQGSQSLFGIKTKLQFGRTTVTAVFSKQESESKSITVEGGAQTNTFNIRADQYEENRHFFLAQYYREHYNEGLSRLPIINSNVSITKIEVWVTNIGPAVTDNRNIVAFQDLGEKAPYRDNIIYPTPGMPAYPDNDANNLLDKLNITTVRNINEVSNYLKSPPLNFVAGLDFEKVESARKLAASEYSFNSKLGFISLNTTLNPDQTLAVAYQYTVVGDTAVYQVGEFSDAGINDPQCLIVKLLKSTAINTRVPMWNLMMKNVYSLRAYQVNSEDFILNIVYSGSDNGVPTGYLSEGDVEGKPLIQVMGLDKLDPQLNPPPDGIFDFIDNAAINGGTIQASNGRIYFPVLEPFGQDLRDSIGDDRIADKYCYDSLYTMTKTDAQQYPDKNKFYLDGYYKSSSGSEISLNALNVPQGSVKVTAGGIALTENVDYTVDYTLGRVRIINEGILNSGTPINISMESNNMFSIQSKRYMGMHIDHKVNERLNLGATIINLHERPLTQKTNLGDDPISNTIWGVDFQYNDESRLITKLIDKLPGIETKMPSKVTIDGEFAHFIPGHPSVIGSSGTSYIDDFEGTKSTIDLKSTVNWFLASTPQGQTRSGEFPEAAIGTGLEYGYNRSKLAWYIIDPLFYDRNGTLVPPNVDNDELSKNEVRQVLETEVFPNKEIPNGTPTNIAVLNMAYYPSERGPYNYDVEGASGISRGLGENGKLKDPETRWGGMMRRIESSDFEATNVEYIEFWLMDPFADKENHSGGELYFNLGDVSEDILRDSRKAFENGLPVSDVVENVDTTIWGRVPNKQNLVEAFDNNTDSRPWQDVGYDGLRDEDERTFFEAGYLGRIAGLYGVGSPAYVQAGTDPSADNYHYFRGTDYDNDPLYSSVLERYKNYNGTEGNSPAAEQSNEAYPTSSTPNPNVEDINKDNTLSEDERYFQYHVDLRPEMMNIGENYISDIYEATGISLQNGDKGSVKWYQFKIPIKRPDAVVGDISDFKSIRFMRMFFKGFSEEIVCRFATLELVRSTWRRYDYDLLAPGEYIPLDDQSETRLVLSTVNIEENGYREPVPYVIPPGIEREINYGTTNFTRLNEQSMSLEIKELLDGDARAVYKNTDFDFRQYERLKMFVHAEDVDLNNPNETGDLTVFLRLGSDFTQNYYEYEIPLEFTPWYTSRTDDEAIWPEANRFDVELQKLVDAKIMRNTDMRQTGSTITLSTEYVVFDGKNKITVVGSPSISDVMSIMIGVRNPKKQSALDLDNGSPRSAIIWVDELRLTDFVNKSGWAAVARVRSDLADIGNIQISGAHSTPGFGAIEQKVNERQMDTKTSIDFATNMQLGRFFPEEWGLRIPMHFDMSHAISSPEYNPLDPDIKLEDDLGTYTSDQAKDSVRDLTQDVVRRFNVNFMNVRKERVGTNQKQRVYDIENFDVSYSYSKTTAHNPDIEFDNRTVYRGGLGYNFTNKPKEVKPFDKVKFLNKSYLKLIKEFNFYYLPKMFSFRTDLNREYVEKKLRNKTQADIIIQPTYMKSYTWNRTYDLKWDLAKSLKLDFKAMADAFIDELPGSRDSDDYGYTAAEKRERVNDQLLSGGTMDRYYQTTSLNYRVPFNNIPILNWINATARYQADYTWTASPQSIQEAMGNSIENANTKQINANARFTKLYNKIPYLKKLNSSRKSARRGPGGMGGPPQRQQKKEQDTADDKDKVNYFKLVADNVLKLMMMVKDGSLTYSETNGTFLPGFLPEPNILGNSTSGSLAPGLPFVFGSQEDIRWTAVENGWITVDSAFNTQYMTKYTTNLNARLTIEPIRDLRIELNATRTYSENYSEYFKYQDGIFGSFSPMTRGSFSISTFMLPTSFMGPDDENNSEAYNNLRDYRQDVAFRLAYENPNWTGRIVDSTGYPEGYGPAQQEVLHYAFLAAYTGKSPASVSLNEFPTIPLPNWRITYKGLTKYDFFKQYFKNFTISHSYRSTYNVGSYVSNILFEGEDGHPAAQDDANNFISQYEIGQITMTEQFAPIFGIDMTWKNSLMSKLEFKKSRNLSLSFVNNQLTEVSSDEFVIGMGYRFKEVPLVFKSMGGTRGKRLKSDLNLKADISVRKNKTILRRIDTGEDQISSGQEVISINFSADYMISQQFNIRFFFDKIINNPYVSNQYSNSTTKGGISMRFTLSE